MRAGTMINRNCLAMIPTSYVKYEWRSVGQRQVIQVRQYQQVSGLSMQQRSVFLSTVGCLYEDTEQLRVM